MDVKKKLRNNLINRIQQLSADKLTEISDLLNKSENQLKSKDQTLQLAGTWKDLNDEVFVDLTEKLHDNRRKDRQIDWSVPEALIDTDILSFYFKGDTKVIERFREYLKEFDQINISLITYYEITAGLKFKNAEKQFQDFEEFIRNNTIIHLSEASAKISGMIYAELRQNGITIGTSDILIAGIAIENGLTLITNNEKHYEPIQALKIENWKK